MIRTLEWVGGIGLILLVACAFWMALAALISYSIQRYFELKEEFQFRMIDKDISEATVEHQIH